MLDARDRVQAVRDRLPAQLGGAAGTLAAFTAYGTPDTGALVEAYARELGLAAPLLPWHTLRTPVADLAGALAFTAGALGKAATDVLTLARTEIRELSEGTGGGSSAMPHKANPVRSTSSPRRPAGRRSSPRRCTGPWPPRTNGPPVPGTPSGSPCVTCCGWSAGPRATRPS